MLARHFKPSFDVVGHISGVFVFEPWRVIPRRL